MAAQSLERAEDSIFLGEPDLSRREKEAVLDVLDRGWLTRGDECVKFEEEFRERVRAEHALAVNSCTSALHLALAIHEIGPGDEVILPSLTFAATGHVVVHQGATPVFADIEETTYCIDPAHVESLITPRTRAVMPVHYAGHPCNLDRLRTICETHGLALIEDAAHALGAAHAGRPIGAGNAIACFSFYSNKNITTGEGGMLTLPDANLFEKAQQLSLHGMDSDAWKRYSGKGKGRYQVTEFGYKYNANDILAALGRVQLSRLDEMQSRRASAWSFYDAMFEDDGRIEVPPVGEGITHARHLYPIRISEDSSARRDEVVETLRDKNIGVAVHYDPLHLHPAYRDRFHTCEGQLPVTERIARNLISLPMHSKLTDQQLNRVSTEVLRLV